MAKNKFKLGETLRDNVTGFQGVATGRHEYIDRCIQYSLSPPVDHDGKLPESFSFDEQRLEKVEDSKVPEMETNKGGPTQRATSPRR